MTRAGVVTAAVVAASVAAIASLVSPEEQAQAVVPEDLPRIVSTCAAGPTQVCDAVDVGVARGPGRYRRVETKTADCHTYEVFSDGGVKSLGWSNRPEKPSARLEIVPGSCVPASSVASARALDGGVPFLAQGCACRKASGVCQYSLADGGVADAPAGKTLGPGYPPYENWSGAGCQPRACVEMAGTSSWPANCPR